MAVLNIFRWNIPLGKEKEYAEWVKGVIPRVLSVPVIKELRAYHGIAGTHQVMAIFEFAKMEDWLKFWESEAVQRIWAEMRTNVTDITSELWGPSPSAPEPLHPK